MLDSPSLKKTVKVGILGDKYVGKTYLAHTITGLSYPGYQETATVSQFQSPDSHQATKFIYVDNPAIDNQSIASIGCIYQYDVLVFLFKDCDSFSKLYEFFDSIKQTLNNQCDPLVKYYWAHPKKIIAAYSNFQPTKVVQLQQLFTILSQEISLFCSQANFQSFILEKQLTNQEALKTLIQQQPIVKSMNEEVSQVTIETQNVQKQQKNVTIQKQQSQKQIQQVEQIEQILKQEVEQYQERAELLSQQRSEVIIINNQPRETLNQQGEATKQHLQVAELTKQIDTASAEVISSEKSQSQINSQKEKNRQSFLTAQNVSKGTQVQKQLTKSHKRSLIQIKKQELPSEQIQMKTQQVRIEHQDEQIMNNQLRKQRINQMIKDSFYGQSLLTDQITKFTIQQPIQTEEIKHSQVPKIQKVKQTQEPKNQKIKQVQEPKIETKEQDLLPSFRQPEAQPEPKIDIQLHKHSEAKNQKLENQRPSSWVQDKQVKKQQKRKSLKKNRESIKKNQEEQLKKEMKEQPQTQFSKNKKGQKQKQLSKEPKNCECQII